MSLSRTISESNSDFSQKSQNFPPRVFSAPTELTGFPLELVIDARSQKSRIMMLSDGPKKFSDRFGHLDTIPACDGRTDTAQQQRRCYAERPAGKSVTIHAFV